MAATTELTSLHRTVDQLREVIAPVRDLDASELDELTPLATVSAPQEVHLLDDTPRDPSLWRDADDEGLGGYHR